MTTINLQLETDAPLEALRDLKRRVRVSRGAMSSFPWSALTLRSVLSLLSLLTNVTLVTPEDPAQFFVWNIPNLGTIPRPAVQ